MDDYFSADIHSIGIIRSYHDPEFTKLVRIIADDKIGVTCENAGAFWSGFAPYASRHLTVFL